MPRPTLQGKNCHEKNIIITNCPSFTSFPGVPCYCLATGCHHHRCRCHCHNEDSNLGIRVTWKHTSKTEPQGQATIPAATGWPSNPLKTPSCSWQFNHVPTPEKNGVRTLSVKAFLKVVVHFCDEALGSVLIVFNVIGEYRLKGGQEPANMTCYCANRAWHGCVEAHFGWSSLG